MSHLGETPTARTTDEVADHLRRAALARGSSYRRIPPDRLYLDAEDEMRHHHEAMISDALAARSPNPEEPQP